MLCLGVPSAVPQHLITLSLVAYELPRILHARNHGYHAERVEPPLLVSLAAYSLQAHMPKYGLTVWHSPEEADTE